MKMERNKDRKNKLQLSKQKIDNKETKDDFTNKLASTSTTARNRDMLLTTDSKLQVQTGLSLFTVSKMRREITEFFPSVQPVSMKNPVHEKWTTGSTDIDFHLRGGFPVRGITEISGESASGKTQFCLQLSLTSQWSIDSKGLNGGVIYISTEAPFPSQRFQELVKCFPSPDQFDRSIYGDRVYLEKALDPDELFTCLDTKVTKILKYSCVRLIIIDSIAGIFRTSMDDGAMQRALNMRRLALYIQKLQLKHNVAVIVTNQVSSYIADEGSREIPALGLSWANLTSTRFRLSKSHDTGVHYIECLSSNEIESDKKWSFKITKSGIVSC